MTLYLDQITVPTCRLGDLNEGDRFILESSLLPRNGDIPPPPMVMCFHNAYHNWSRVFPPLPGDESKPTSGRLDLNERVIVVQ